MEELFQGLGWKLTLEEALLPDGRIKKAVIVERSDSVHIIARPTTETVLLLREYRPFYGAHIWMLPSGRADKEDDSTVAAQRELQEETGFRAGALRHIWTTRHSESVRSANHIYLADQLTPSPLPKDEDESMEVHSLPFEEALDKILASEVVHTPSAYALLRFLRDRPL